MRRSEDGKKQEEEEGHSPDGRHRENVPLNGGIKFGEVNADLHDGVVLLLIDVAKVYLQHHNTWGACTHLAHTYTTYISRILGQHTYTRLIVCEVLKVTQLGQPRTLTHT